MINDKQLFIICTTIKNEMLINNFNNCKSVTYHPKIHGDAYIANW